MAAQPVVWWGMNRVLKVFKFNKDQIKVREPGDYK